MTVLAVVATGSTAAYYLWSIRRIFFGQVPDGLEDIRDPPRLILVITGIMAFVVVILGVWPWMLWRFIGPVLTGVVGGG